MTVKDNLDEVSINESLGFRNITLTLSTVSSPTSSSCGSSTIPFNDARYCACTASQYTIVAGSGTCYNCDSSCATCIAGTSTSCTSCASGYYFVNGNSCYPTCPAPLTISTSGSNTVCSTPCSGSYVYWDSSCAATCTLPNIPSTVDTFNICSFPCLSTAYLYWNGTCASACNLPLVSSVQKSRNYCTYPCSSSEYLYFNGSCLASCTIPFSLRVEAGYNYCDYPCTGTNYLYWNGSCLSACSNPFTQRVQKFKNFCDFGCLSTQFLYQDKSCSYQCSNSWIDYREGGLISRDFCISPCSSTSQYQYWNGTCTSTCTTPLASSIQYSQNICSNPCPSNQYLYWNGSCFASCSLPLVIRVEPGVNYCDYPCTGSEYLYWNGSCISSCNSPLSTRIEASKRYCDFGCSTGQFLYWDQSCFIHMCKPTSTKVEGTSTARSFCTFPCSSTTQYLYWNGTCSSTCAVLLTSSTFKARNLCSQTCAAGLFLYFNGSCLSTCPYPLSPRIEGDVSYCDYPCTGSEYLYWNGSCISSCNTPLSTRIEASKRYCDFGCSTGQFLYWDQSCSPTCASPLVQKVEGTSTARSFCTFPCSSTTQYLYWNGTCSSTCAVLLTSSIFKTRNLCSQTCAAGLFLYFNGSCLSTCPYPLSPRIEGDVSYCDYPCMSTEYLYWNGSCISSCNTPLSPRTEASRNYCDFRCPASQFLYWDQSCSSTCASPLIQKEEGTLIARSFCTFPCSSTTQYLYWNGTCSSTCTVLLTSSVLKARNFCLQTCAVGLFLYFNGSCLSNCPYPLSTRIEGDVSYCDYPCTDSQYLYWNGSCISSCNTPLSSRVEATKNYCDFGCPTGQLLYWDQSCSSTCASPLVQKVEGISTARSFCTFPCSSTTQYLYWNGTCASSCSSILVSNNLNSRQFCNYPCAANQFLYWNGSCLNSCPCTLISRVQATGQKFCDFSCSSSEYLYWNGSCISTCNAPLSARLEIGAQYCDFPCAADEFSYWNGTCSARCPFPLTQDIQGATEIRQFCSYKCSSGQLLNWNGECISTCPAPYVNMTVGTDRYCNLPCDDQNPYFYRDQSTCYDRCNTSYTLVLEQPYLQCIFKNRTTQVVGTNSQLTDILLVTPTKSGTISFTTPFKLMQYVRYLDMQMPPRLQKFAVSEGRTPLSVKSGMQMSEEQKAKFALGTIPSIFNDHNFHSDFFVNYWENFTTLLIGLILGIVFSLLQSMCKHTRQALLESVFGRLAVIMKWNFCVMVLAYNVDDVILFTSIELSTFSAKSATPAVTIIGLIFNLLIIGLIFGLLISVFYVVTRHRQRGVRVVPAEKKEGYEDFDQKWKAYQVFYRGFRDNHFIAELFFLIYTMRIAVPMLFTVSVSYSPVTVIICQITVSAIMIVFLIVKKPFKKKVNLVQILMVEVLVFAMNVCVLAIAILSLSGKSGSAPSVFLGDLVVFGNGLVNALFVAFLIIRCVQEGTKIVRGTKQKALRGLKEKTAILQLLGLIVQQSNMGFEELIEDYPENNNTANKRTEVENKNKRDTAKMATILKVTDNDKLPSNTWDESTARSMNNQNKNLLASGNNSVRRDEPTIIDVSGLNLANNITNYGNDSPILKPRHRNFSRADLISQNTPLFDLGSESNRLELVKNTSNPKIFRHAHPPSLEMEQLPSPVLSKRHDQNFGLPDSTRNILDQFAFSPSHPDSINSSPREKLNQGDSPTQKPKQPWNSTKNRKLWK